MNRNKNYLETAIKTLNGIHADNKYLEAGELIADAYENKKKVYTFGTGHSHMLGEELYARAGGWDYITPMLLDEITLSSHPFKSTLIERVEGFADVILGLWPLQKDDVIIISSNSGRNPLLVEMAIRSQKIGAKIIVVTSIEHSSSVTSRHASGKLIKDFADVIIDNRAPVGDSTVVTESKNKIAPISTISAVFIGHQMVISALDELDRRGVDYNVFVSSNLDGQDERNQKLMKGNK